MRKLALLAAATLAATALSSTGALADPPNVTPATNPCTSAYVVGAIACQGYYTGNFFQGTAGQATTDEAKAAIALLLNGTASTADTLPTNNLAGYNPPYNLDYDTILAAIGNQADGDSTFDFGPLQLTGLTIFGAHFGNNTDGGDATNISAVWLIDFGSTTTDTVTLLNGQGVSNAQIFATGGTAVPEPATWAMMLVGFGATGVAIRRRRRRKEFLTQIA